VIEFIKELNKAQQEAVKDIYGPSLIIAGAGSGKTRVLTYRIAYLLAQGIPAGSILALTFTNKAAGEMKKRIIELVGAGTARNLWMGTFHSVFSRILRMEAPLLGYTSHYSIYDTDDSKGLLKGIIKEMNLNDEIYKPSDVLSRISTAKNNLVTAEAYSSNSKIQQADTLSRKPLIADIYRRYQGKCREADAMDFDDLLLNMNILLRDFPEVLEKYRQAFGFILVDEYQDTNYSQYLIIRRLAENHQNVCVVGDDAQSIYSFRGARIENILNFRNDYPEYKLHKLEQNYRSTKNIVGAANSLILKNQNQIHKTIWSENSPGSKIRVFTNASDLEEGAVIANSIYETQKTGKDHYRDFAILYRTNAQSRIFEEALMRRNIPYKVYGGVSFYQRREIKDLLAYMKLVVNPRDSGAFLRVINYPARGVGKTTIDKLNSISKSEGLQLFELAGKIDQYTIAYGIARGTSEKIKSFTHLIEEFKRLEDSLSAHELALQIATRSGILRELYDPSSPENIQKFENIQELLNGVKEFVQQSLEEGTPASLSTFLQNIALMTDADKDKEGDLDKVTIMTIHSAKGLEFNHVYIAGVEEELFPGRYSTLTQDDLEEERRLFYVALTRAKSIATISHATQRMRWGSMVYSAPSRFIEEIDPSYLEHYENPYSGKQVKTGTKDRRPERRIGPDSGKLVPGDKNLQRLRRNPPTGDVQGTPVDSEIQPGMIVYHEKFGKGKVLQVEGDAGNLRATVFFHATGQKHLLLKYARLKILEN
jgi:DNA helicase II / ATP-dependent DNA helicase PcrA